MKKLNRILRKGTSIALVSALVCGSVSTPAFAQDQKLMSILIETGLNAIEREPVDEAAPQVAELTDTDRKQLEKEETVYVIANADGSPQKLIVSDWLKNALGKDQIHDVTELTDISNVKGEEGFVKTNGSLGLWDAAGNDIYYQGSIQKELPVDLKITYQLDGKEISPEELAGKSGKVTIHFDYTNRQKERVQVGDREEELYVPFVMITSMVLDNENFHHVEVSNGKIINDGERTIVMGYAMPGLKDNLDIGSEDFDIEELDLPDYVELTADVTDFELMTTMTVATNEVFSDLDMDPQEKMDELSDDMDELSDAMDELMDGTSELYDGVLELYDGTIELKDGMDELDDGAGELRDGAGELRDGVGTLKDGAESLNDGAGKLQTGVGALKSGAQNLYSGTGTLKSGTGELVAGIGKLVAGISQLTEQNAALNNGAKQVFETLLNTANQQLAANGLNYTLTIDNYGAVLDGAVQEMEGQLAALKQAATGIQAAMEEAQRQEIQAAIAAERENILRQAAENQMNVLQNETDTEPVEEEIQGEALEEVQEEVIQEVQETTQDTSDNSEVQTTNEGTLQTQPEENQPVESDNILQAESQSEEPQSEELQSEEPQAAVQEKEVTVVQAGNMPSTPQELAEAIGKLEAAIPVLKGLKAQLDSYNQFYQGLQAYTEGVNEVNKGAQELLEGAKKLNAGANDLWAGTGILKDGTDELKTGVDDLKAGTGELKDGADKLKDGADELKAGTDELKDGTEELKDGGQELKDGVEELRDGSKELDDGVIELNDEGIQKLIDTFDGDLQELADRFQATKTAAQAYKSFAGIADDTEGNVRFIYKTDAVKLK